MAESSKRYCLFLSAAEPSGDLHCAGLISALRKGGYDIEFVGVGGPKMASAGCRLLETTTGRAAMIYKAFYHIGRYYRLIRRITRFLKSNKVDLVVVCDSPAFNFHIAGAARKAGIKTVFYIAPQLWAWAGWRIRKLRKYCHKLCCILPFEQSWFVSRGVDTVFVGNPLLDGLPADLDGYKRGYGDFNPRKADFALMPGSRNAEIESLWQPMQQIALRLQAKYPQVSFTAVAVDGQREQMLKAGQLRGFQCRYSVGSVVETAEKADFSIVASGSATLQVAAVGCPMVVMYQSSRILWHLLGRWLMRTRYLSLVNVLADRRLVPEFMPYFTSIEPIAECIEHLLEDRGGLAQISNELVELAKPLSVDTAAERTAQIVGEILDK